MSEWVEASLSELVSFQKGRKVETSPFLLEGYADYLGASGIEGVSDGFASTRFAVLAKPSDTLMLWDGERSGLVGFGRQGVVASTVSRLSPNDKTDPKFLYFALSGKFDWIQHRRTGTGVPHVPKDIGRILRLRFPKEKPVQRKIAAILSGIDTAIEKTEALIAKYQQIKAGLMHDLFTRGVLANGQLRPPREQAPELYQETTIGWLPREWRIFTFEEITDTPICYGIVQVLNYVPSGVPVLAIKDLLGDFSSDIHRTAPRIDAMYPRSRVKAGDVLLSIKGTVGRVDVVPVHFAGNISRDIALLRPTAKIRSFYFAHFLRSKSGQGIIKALLNFKWVKRHAD
jgi:type I restriction enzyme S subunit